MDDRRKKNAEWLLNLNVDGTAPNDQAQLAVLMDIRDELQKLNRVFECHNFLAIPNLLQGIKTNTTKKRRKRMPRGSLAQHPV